MFSDRFVKFLPGGKTKKALRFFNSGNYKKAIAEFEGLMEEAKDSKSLEMVRMYLVEALIEYAKELDNRGKSAAAVQQLEKAVKYQPGYADVHYFLGTLYEKTADEESAIESFRKALDINPNFFRARIRLSRCHHTRGEKDWALSELDIALKIAPSFFVESVKKLIELVNNDGNPDEVEEIYSQFLEEVPSSSQISRQIAMKALQDGDNDTAIYELKKALSMKPDYPDLHNLLGIALTNKGMVDDAIMEFKTALKIHPDYLKARLNLALAYYEKGAIGETAENLKLVLRLDPENELAINLMNEIEPVLKR